MTFWAAALAIIGSKLGDHYGAVQKYLGPVATIVVGGQQRVAAFDRDQLRVSGPDPDPEQ
jgi:hypothetical protein